MQIDLFLPKKKEPSDAKSSRSSPRSHWTATFLISRRRERLANVRSLKQVVVVVFFWDLYLSLHLHLSLPPSLPLAVTPLPLSPSSLGRIKGWGRGSLCRLCWDLWCTDLIFTLTEKLAALMWGCGGAGPTGTAEVAHFFFFLLTQHSQWGFGVEGAHCWGQGVLKNRKWLVVPPPPSVD